MSDHAPDCAVTRDEFCTCGWWPESAAEIRINKLESALAEATNRHNEQLRAAFRAGCRYGWSQSREWRDDIDLSAETRCIIAKGEFDAAFDYVESLSPPSTKENE